MSRETSKRAARRRRQLRARRKIAGTPDRPRLCVTKTLQHMYAQVIDDDAGQTLVAASTREVDMGQDGHAATIAAAKKVGEVVGQRAIDKGIRKVVFDRASWPYHGRVQAVAEGAREAGLKF